jgi:kumamolisin
MGVSAAARECVSSFAAGMKIVEGEVGVVTDSSGDRIEPTGYVRLAGSERSLVSGAERVGPADPKEEATVSVRVRRRPDVPPLPSPVESAGPEGSFPTREEFSAKWGASEADLDAVGAFADENGLEVVERSVARRTVVLRGTVDQLSRTFGVSLGRYQLPDGEYRGREGHVLVPEKLAGIIQGVFGLDNRRMARRAIIYRHLAPTLTAGPVTPPEVAALYNFPTDTSAAGQTIGLIEFAPGAGYERADLDYFFQETLGRATPNLVDISVDGATNDPWPRGAQGEVTLDIDVAGGAAEGANLAVYFAPWTEQGWVDVISTAVHDTTNRPVVLSVSWGWPENEQYGGLAWTPQAIATVSEAFQEAAALGVTVLVSAGDDGTYCGIYDGKAHVLYPASDPYVTGCGGTTLLTSVGLVFSETVWNGGQQSTTGGGISDIFGLPDFQAYADVDKSGNDGHAGRGVPDIAGNADGNTGYPIRIHGMDHQGGGTSATAPLYAGLVALLAAHLGKPVGYLNPRLYELASNPSQYSYVFRDIVSGNNAETYSNAHAPSYSARAGWDACTGLGGINGSHLLEALKQGVDPCWPLPQMIQENTVHRDTLQQALDDGELPPPPRTPAKIALVQRSIDKLTTEINAENRALAQCRAQNP